MLSAQDYLDQDNEIKENNPLAATLKNVSQAKLVKNQLSLAQKQLRQVKKEINETIKTIRLEFNAKSENAGSGGKLILSLLGQKGAGKSYGAASKKLVKAKKEVEINPYEQVKTIIDKYLLAYDELKLKIDDYIETHK